MRVIFSCESAWEDDVDTEPLNSADLSLEAALELEELKQHIRDDAPALYALFRLIRTPLPAYNGESVSMLADARAYPVLRDSTRSADTVRDYGDFKTFFERYLNELEDGVSRADLDKIDEAKRFCLALNTQVIAKEMGEFYTRRERHDSRNIFDDPIL
jgi:hypothetical protein